MVHRSVKFTAQQVADALSGRCLRFNEPMCGRNTIPNRPINEYAESIWQPDEVLAVREPFTVYRENSEEENAAIGKAADDWAANPSLEGLLEFSRLPRGGGPRKVLYEADMLGWDVDWSWSGTARMDLNDARLFICVKSVVGGRLHETDETPESWRRWHHAPWETNPLVWTVNFGVVGHG